MKYNMKLNNDPFNHIKAGTKTIEMRLNDEKRQLLKEQDLIEFTNIATLETILVEIVKLYKYANFEELYKHFDKISLGYDKDDIANPKDIIPWKNKKNMELLG